MPLYRGVGGGFWPRLVYASTTINIERPRNVQVTPVHTRGVNRAMSGRLEVLDIRTQMRVEMSWERLSTVTLTALYTYWNTWGKLGKQATLILDAKARATGYWEYDQWNAYFTKAELVDDAVFQPTAGRMRTPPLHDLTLAWIQGV